MKRCEVTYMTLDDRISKGTKIFKEFRRGVFYEELYRKYQTTENNLISILNRNIKGNYDYKRILSGGLQAQKQFLKHLNTRWNPLKTDEPFENKSPYLNGNPFKKKIS